MDDNGEIALGKVFLSYAIHTYASYFKLLTRIWANGCTGRS
jgi:hypothetical protein